MPERTSLSTCSSHPGCVVKSEGGKQTHISGGEKDYRNEPPRDEGVGDVPELRLRIFALGAATAGVVCVVVEILT